ncbi:MAG TPA: hypothetical protein VKV28_09065 [Candidatus Binataceae bacterium]|nr:hypothetical protein [Candidatus Binataceae bacterium]
MRTAAPISFKVSLLIVVLALLVEFIADPVQAQTPTKAAKLVAASIVFHTTDRAKPADTAVSVTLSRAGAQIAQVRDLTGRFDSNSTNGPFALDVATSISADQLPGLTPLSALSLKKVRLGNSITPSV